MTERPTTTTEAGIAAPSHEFSQSVGNNTPVFFIREPQKVAEFIHSQKPRSDTHMRDNNMQWDFWTGSPESAHQVTFLMSDRGPPSTWRNVNGYGSHTFLWYNAGGE